MLVSQTKVIDLIFWPISVSLDYFIKTPDHWAGFGRENVSILPYRYKLKNM
jgi:hypothetical protein